MAGPDPSHPGLVLPDVPARGGESGRQRLARLAEWLITGRAAGAELELYEWRRQSDCPPAARVLLAASLALRQQVDLALAVLPRYQRIESADDAAAVRLLISLLVGRDYHAAARRLVCLLHRQFGQDAATIAWIDAMQVPGVSELPQLPDATVEQLTADLEAQPEVIPTLVAAQKIEPATDAIYLLRRSVAHVYVRLAGQEPHNLACCTALAELAMLSSDEDDARRWAHRGLKLNPYHAPLALVLSRIQDDAELGPPAALVLAGVAAANPGWPDVRAALIRRELADGQDQQARHRLEQWLREEPASTMARQLQKEIAA